MQPIRLPIVVALTLLAVACASDPARTVTDKESFATQITTDGTKDFGYSFQFDGGGGRGERGGGMGGGGMGGGGMHGGGRHGGGKPGGGRDGEAGDRESAQSRMQQKANDRLTAKLAATGYCRSGFTLMDSQFERGHVQLSGYCNEKASAADRTAYPNDPGR